MLSMEEMNTEIVDCNCINWPLNEENVLSCI
jgi:hypothetical protein